MPAVNRITMIVLSAQCLLLLSACKTAQPAKGPAAMPIVPVSVARATQESVPTELRVAPWKLPPSCRSSRRFRGSSCASASPKARMSPKAICCLRSTRVPMRKPSAKPKPTWRATARRSSRWKPPWRATPPRRNSIRAMPSATRVLPDTLSPVRTHRQPAAPRRKPARRDFRLLFAF